MNAAANALAAEDDAREQNVTRILEAAERLFRVYGYSKTNVADIARDLGMSPANVYRFFRSKADIHKALAERMLADARAITDAIAASDAPALDRLRAFALGMHKNTVETMMDQEKVHEMVIVALEQQWDVVEEHIMLQAAAIGRIIADAVACGELPPQDVELSAKCFIGGIVSIVHPQNVAQCPPVNHRATPEQLVEFLIRALKAPGA